MRDEDMPEGYSSASEHIGKDHVGIPEFTEEQLGDADLNLYEAERSHRHTEELARKTPSAVDRFCNWLFKIKP